MWILASMGKIQPTGYVPYLWGESLRDHVIISPNYFYIYFETQHIDIDILGLRGMYRNTGIFTEGPMFNFCLCTSLSIELFLREVVKKWRIIILVVAIFTTFSTTGFAFIIGAFFLFSMSKKRWNLKVMIWTILQLSVIALCVYIFFTIVVAEKEDTISYQERVGGMKEGLEIWFSAPFFGTGYATNTGSKVTANGILRMLADGGVFFSLLYVISFLVIPYHYYTKNKNRALLPLFLLMFFLLFPTVAHNKTVTFMFIAFAFSLLLRKTPNNRKLFHLNNS
jgi:hypothetical protein